MNIKKYFILICSFVLVIFFCSTSHAQERYRTELSIEYISSEYEDNDENKLYGVTGEVHFSEVDTQGHPYNEAAFLERIGSIELLYGKGEMEIGSLVEADGPQYGAMLTYMKPNLPFAIQVIYVKSKFEFDPPVNGDTESNSYGIKIGHFFTDGLIVDIGYNHSETDFTIPTISIDKTTKHDDYELSAKFVKEKLEGTAYNVEGSLGISQFDDGTDDGSNAFVMFSGDYYFNRRISLGGELEINSGDEKDEEGKTLGIDFNTFITPSFSINISFEKFFADNDEGEDEKTFFFGILARF